MRVSATRGAYLDVGWGQVHYRTAQPSATEPLLVILHQSPLSSKRYELALPLLASRVRPVAIDTPGYGASGRPPREWEVEEYAELVWQLVDEFGHNSAILLGRATGAVFALEAAVRQPARCLALVLHGFPLYTPEERASRAAGFADPYRVDASGSHLRALWTRIYDQYPGLDPMLASSFVEDYLAAGPDYAAGYRAIWRHDPQESLEALSCPTVLLSGTRDRVLTMHRRATERLGHARSVILEGATDFVAEQQPELFVSAVLGALDDLGALAPRDDDALREA